MRTLKIFSILLLCALTAVSFSSCESDSVLPEVDKPEIPSELHTCKLILNVTRTEYDDATGTRAAYSWTNGDKIYLTFKVDSGTTYGDAIYTDGTWSVNYYGALSEGKATQCSAVYFEGAEFESSSVVKLSAGTGIYEDTNGSYIFNNGTLSVTADLTPKVGRIRFAGTDDEEISVYGISHYTSYDCSNGKFSSSLGAIPSKVVSGYTPYLYGFFSDNEHPRLNMITSTSGYTRGLSNTIFQKGQSGYMTIPTEESHNGWQNSLIFEVNGVEFTMIPVVREEGNYFLAETETTNELYGCIMNKTSSYPQHPVFTDSSNFSTFLSKLNALTELEFDIPSLDEWLYAAKGGKKSQDYIYSGSNIISDVAWYNGNSGGASHPVKQLQPNELGFYDMSGNADECVKVDNNPNNQTGGKYNDTASYCAIESTPTSGYYNSGLRFILRLK